MKIELTIGRLIGAIEGDCDEFAAKLLKRLENVDKGMTEAEKILLAINLTEAIQEYDSLYDGEILSKDDIVEFVSGIKTLPEAVKTAA